MASDDIQSGNEHVLTDTKLDDALISLLWGAEIKQDVFDRWSQGFIFSTLEPLALIQLEGGPCAVIASVQAFMLKNLLFKENITDRVEWTRIIQEHRCTLLASAIQDIIAQVSEDNKYTLVLVNDTHTQASDAQTADETAPSTEAAAAAEAAHTSSQTSHQQEPTTTHSTSNPSSSKRQKFSTTPDEFHAQLICHHCTSLEQLSALLHRHMKKFCGTFGVLLLLYSVIYTKGLERIKDEMEDITESLINSQFGHGSQSLINLFLTGKAVSNVWDNDKDVSGLKLRGICQQSVIGFLTQLEHLRYCEVGWYLKNPKFPIWMLASEYHLTVLFSTEERLVSTETDEQLARRMFSSMDTEGSGFIAVDQLGNLMKLLDLVSDVEYVKIMAMRLDPEQLGVITLNAFMEEFYPGEKQESELSQFKLYHYNGITRNNTDGKVMFHEGVAKLMDMPELQIVTDYDVTPIKTCLMTKWPTLDLKWNSDHIPSIN